MDEAFKTIEPTWGIALRFWWAYFWRAIIYAMGVGIVFGIIGVLFEHLFGFADVRPIVMALSGIFGIGISIFIIKSLLNKNFKTFRILVVENRSSNVIGK